MSQNTYQPKSIEEIMREIQMMRESFTPSKYKDMPVQDYSQPFQTSYQNDSNFKQQITENVYQNQPMTQSEPYNKTFQFKYEFEKKLDSRVEDIQKNYSKNNSRNSSLSPDKKSNYSYDYQTKELNFSSQRDVDNKASNNLISYISDKNFGGDIKKEYSQYVTYNTYEAKFDNNQDNFSNDKYQTYEIKNPEYEPQNPEISEQQKVDEFIVNDINVDDKQQDIQDIKQQEYAEYQQEQAEYQQEQAEYQQEQAEYQQEVISNNQNQKDIKEDIVEYQEKENDFKEEYYENYQNQHFQVKENELLNQQVEDQTYEQKFTKEEVCEVSDKQSEEQEYSTEYYENEIIRLKRQHEDIMKKYDEMSSEHSNLKKFQGVALMVCRKQQDARQKLKQKTFILTFMSVLSIILLSIIIYLLGSQQKCFNQ